VFAPFLRFAHFFFSKHQNNKFSCKINAE